MTLRQDDLGAMRHGPVHDDERMEPPLKLTTPSTVRRQMGLREATDPRTRSMVRPTPVRMARRREVDEDLIGNRTMMA